MKIEYSDAFAAKSINVPETTTGYYNRRNQMNKIFELEVEDFDKAIQLMMLNNKAGVKEFTLLKEEFQTLAAEGKKLDVDDYCPSNLLKRWAATKRLSDVEKRKVEKQIKWWNEELREKAGYTNSSIHIQNSWYDAKIKQYEV